MRHNTTTVFIAGAGHSGSTLLGMILGAHPDVFYAGECAKARFLGDLAKPLHKRTCKLCGPDCPVWSTFVWRSSPDLYEQLARHTDTPVVVDSSKGLDWIPERAASVRAHGGRAVLLFLLRDGRAVVNSRVRKYPQRPPADEIRRWQASIEGTRDLYQRWQGPRLEVRYEALCTAPEPTLAEVCEVVGISPLASQLRFDEHEHHVLGGNDGTQFQVARTQGLDGPEPSGARRAWYARHPGGITLDERWRHELEPAVGALFDRLAGETNHGLTWPPAAECRP